MAPHFEAVAFFPPLQPWCWLVTADFWKVWKPGLGASFANLWGPFFNLIWKQFKGRFFVEVGSTWNLIETFLVISIVYQLSWMILFWTSKFSLIVAADNCWSRFKSLLTCWQGRKICCSWIFRDWRDSSSSELQVQVGVEHIGAQRPEKSVDVENIFGTYLLPKVSIGEQHKLSEDGEEPPGQGELDWGREIEYVPWIFPDTGHLSARAESRHEAFDIASEEDDVEEQDEPSTQHSHYQKEIKTRPSKQCESLIDVLMLKWYFHLQIFSLWRRRNIEKENNFL